MITSENVNELFAALSKAQGEFGNAHKDAKNPYYKSNYATLTSVLGVVREPLAKHGLAVIQGLQGAEYHTVLTHSSGQFAKFIEPFVPVKNDPQSVGSLKSYIRRYSLMGLLGLAQEDDDAESAMPSEPIQNQSPVALKPTHTTAIGSKTAPAPRLVSEAQVKFFHTMASKHGLSVDAVKQMLLTRFKVDSSKLLTMDVFNDALAALNSLGGGPENDVR